MNPAQHTKGLLKVFPDIGAPAGTLKIAPEAWLGAPFSVPLVAAVFGTADEQRYFANLFAAAPELLAALEAILAESDHDGYSARTDAQIPRLRAALGTARTAIAKAKGGAT